MNIVIGNAWPYANSELHLGRIAVLLPGDILARYHRLMGDNVVFVSGSDSHGTPVTMKAKEENVTPEEVSTKYHEKIKKCFEDLDFSFDFFTKTHTEYHASKVKNFIMELYNKGYIYEKTVEQMYCENCGEYLLDRYIEGKCPCCGADAIGEQCGECSSIFESEELLEKKCTFCKCEPVMKKTKHLYFALSRLEQDVKRMYIKQHGWRENAQKITKRYLDEGLRDRGVTRDFNWGIDVPLKGYEDKKIYVWIEAVMGYLTASIKCLEEINEDYAEYWDGEDSKIYFVHGKDNIPFHTVIFPAILAGLGFKNPNIVEISSEYLKLEGKNFSAAKNWAVWAKDILKNYNSDLIRYYLILNGPENKDTVFSWKEFVSVNNNDLVGLMGNFINRVLVFVKNNFHGEIPKCKLNPAMYNKIFNYYRDIGENIEEGKFKKALRFIISMAKEGNKYFDEAQPWKTVKNNIEKCRYDIYVCIQYIANMAVLMEPFIPKTSSKIKGFLHMKNSEWIPVEISDGKIDNLEILFEKIDKENIDKELKKLNT